MNVSIKLQQIEIIFVSGNCIHCFIFKICQTVAGISKINQFREYLADLGEFWPTVRLRQTIYNSTGNFLLGVCRERIQFYNQDTVGLFLNKGF